MRTYSTQRLDRYVLFASLVVIAIYGILFWATFGSQVIRTVGDPPARIEYGQDLRAFLGAGQLATERDGRAIYDEADPVYTDVGASKFVYPPWFAMAMMPFASVPFAVVFPLWSLLGVAAMWLALDRARAPGAKQVIGVSLLTLSGIFALYYGQTTFFMVAVLMLAATALASGSGLVGAVGVAMLAFKPHLLLGIGVWWVLDIRARWRWVAVAGAVTGALAVVSAVWLPGAWPEFFRAVGDPSSLVDPAREVTLISVVRLLGASGAVLAFGIILVVAGVLSLLFAGMRRFSGQVEVAASFAIIASLLLAPHGLMYDWLLLIPAGVLLVRARVVDPAALGVLGGVLGAVLAAGDIFSAWQLEVLGWAIHVAPLVLAGMFAWLVLGQVDIPSRTGVAADRP